MKQLRVLIADDSVVYRSQIKAALSSIPWIEVVGVASNGRLALDRMEQSSVDLLILDLEMPEMDGVQTLAALNQKSMKCKVLVFSSASKKGAEITLEALRLGASDFIAKPGPNISFGNEAENREPSVVIREMLEPKILALFSELDVNTKTTPVLTGKTKFPSVIWDLFQPKVLVIGSSTGGPTVLEKIFSNVAAPLRCPILITQHMPPVFTATLAERLQKLSGIKTYEGKHDQVVENAIYVAPGNFHMTLTGSVGNLRICLDQGPLVNSVRPAVDNLFESAAKIFGERCLGIVLTGMGSDGKVGAERIKSSGGVVVIQDEPSCVVFGMPGAVMASGAYDRVFNPNEIIEVICNKAAALGIS